MIVFFAQNVIGLLTSGNSRSWLVNLNLNLETNWIGVGSRVLGKLSSKDVGGFLFLLNWIQVVGCLYYLNYVSKNLSIDSYN